MIKTVEGFGRICSDGTSYPILETVRGKRGERRLQGIDYELENGREARTRLIATMPFANPEFYEGLQETLCDGGVPILETVQGPSPEKLELPANRTIKAYAESVCAYLRAVVDCTKYDLTLQNDWRQEAFPADEGNISIEEMAECLRKRGCDFDWLRNNIISDYEAFKGFIEANPKRADKYVESVLNNSRFSYNRWLVRLRNIFSAKRRALEEVLTLDHNNFLFSRIMECYEEGATVPRIAHRIRNLHYRLVDTQRWYPDPVSVRYRTIIDGSKLKA